MNQNPLSNYFRHIKVYTKIPSNGKYYEPGILGLSDTNEVGVMAMTGNDELLFKNPDALLNGEALAIVLKSCVPTLSDPKKLLSNDIDALITAIRLATYNDELTSQINCPNCNHQNTFRLNLSYPLDTMTFLDPEYIINLESGLKVYIKPAGFNEVMSEFRTEFEKSKLERTISNKGLSEEQRLLEFSEAFKKLSHIAFDNVCNCIIKIEDNIKNIVVSDKTFIKEFLENIENTDLRKITDLLTAINKLGVNKIVKAKCEKCSHEWDAFIDFNPTNFS